MQSQGKTIETAEKDVIPVLDTGISFCKSLYYKEIDYRV